MIIIICFREFLCVKAQKQRKAYFWSMVAMWNLTALIHQTGENNSRCFVKKNLIL